MTIADRVAIADRLETALSAVRPGLQFDTDPNAVFTPPQNTPWLRLTILDGDERQVGVGGNTSPFRQPLNAYIDIFVPGGSGDGDAVVIDGLVRTAFRGWSAGQLGGATFRQGPEGRDAGGTPALYRKQIIVVLTRSFRA